MKFPRKWELLNNGFFERLKVPGGWLVKDSIWQGGGMAFLPDPKHEWELEEPIKKVNKKWFK